MASASSCCKEHDAAEPLLRPPRPPGLKRNTLFHLARIAAPCLLIAALGWTLAPMAHAQDKRAHEQEELPPEPPLGLDDVPVPENNPMTRPKVELGRMLYFEKRFSGDGKVSCATCHMPRRGFSNARQYGTGFDGRLTLRNVPTVINAAYNESQFWDGRAGSLEEQAKGPILHPSEMASSEAKIIRTLGAIPEYRQRFAEAFGSPGISLERVVRAIATFERTVLSGNSPFDRWKFGGGKSALSPRAIKGFKVFTSNGNCVKCHLVDEFSASFTDDKFHNIGIGMDKKPLEIGREKITRKIKDRGKFKTPTLRHINQTAPYMHDGRFATLEEVVDFYEEGGHPNPHLDPDMKPLKLTKTEKEDLIAFMGALTGDLPEIKAPELPK